MMGATLSTARQRPRLPAQPSRSPVPPSTTADPPTGVAPARRTATTVGDLTINAWVWDSASATTQDRYSPPGPSGPQPPAFVLVHGLGASSRYFRPLAERLAAHGAVHSLDLPGFGSAPDPGRDLDIDDHAAVIGQYVRTHGLDRPVLVGHSMGAQVVAQLLVQDPATTDSAVLVGPTVERAAATVPRQGFRLLRDQLHERPAAIAIMATDSVVRCGPGNYRRHLRHMLDHDMEATVAAVTANLLVVRGSRDPVAPREWTHRLAGLAPRGTFLELPGPHAVMMTHPELVAEVVAERAHVRT